MGGGRDKPDPNSCCVVCKAPDSTLAGNVKIPRIPGWAHSGSVLQEREYLRTYLPSGSAD
jgi:hypothetical protein